MRNLNLFWVNNKASITANESPVVSWTAKDGVADTIDLSWTDVGADSYTVRRRINGNISWILVTSGVAVTTYQFSVPTPGEVYDFQIEAVFASSDNTFGELLNVASVPPIPVITFGTVTETSIVVNWSSVLGADYYRVQYKASATETYFSLDSPTTDNTETALGLSSGTSYDFRVASYDVDTYTEGYSAPYTQSTTTPPPPQPTVSVLSVTNTQVALDWQDIVEADTFTVEYRLQGAGVWTTEATGLTTPTDYTVTGLDGNLIYEFRVGAVNTGGTTWSTTTTQTTEPNPVVSLGSSIIDASSFQVSWSQPTNGADSYDVYAQINGGGYLLEQAAVAGTSYTFNTVTRGDVYDVQVHSINAVGSTIETTSGITIQEAPTAATGITFSSIAKTSFNVSYTPGSNVENYDIQTSPQGAGTWTTRVTGTTSTTNVTVSGLIQETAYDVRIISNGFLFGETATSGIAQVTTIGTIFLRPTSDISVSGWTTSPFFSKVNDQSDATFIVSGNNNGDTVTVRISNTTGSVITNPNFTVRVRKQAGGENATTFAATGTNAGATQIVSISQDVSSTTFVDLSATASGTIAAGGYLDVQLTRSGGGNPNNRRGVDCAEIWISF